MTAIAPAPPETLAAYRHCERVTRTQARNFSYGIALLPSEKRRALSAVYAYARRIDDITDDAHPAEQKLAGLGQARAEISALAGGAPAPRDDQVLVALGDAVRRFPVPLAAFGELIDGCEADTSGVSYETFADLERYCRCVAGSIGRLSLGVFGASDMAAAAPLADALGIALQLTNVLRDIREDLAAGRVYLPAEDLDSFGCPLSPGEPGDLDQPAARSALERLVRFEAERARAWYATGLTLLPMLDWRSAASAGAMAGIYRRLLERISDNPAEVLRTRISLSGREKALVATQALTGRTRRMARRRLVAAASPGGAGGVR